MASLELDLAYSFYFMVLWVKIFFKENQYTYIDIYFTKFKHSSIYLQDV